MTGNNGKSVSTVGAFLHYATALLTQSGVATARLDTLVLLEDVLQIDRAQLLAHEDRVLSQKQFSRLSTFVHRRERHEPLAYIRNKTEFYCREFYIDHHVLEPRPESETMIASLLKIGASLTPTIIDVGTGSGALAITSQLEIPDAHVIGLDIDPLCLRVALKNNQSLHAGVTLLESDLLQSLTPSTLDRAILLCNLPYVPDDFVINPAAMHEPERAIFGGLDGLDVYRRLFEQIASSNQKPSFVLTESLPPQHTELLKIATLAGYVFDSGEDFIQVFRNAICS